MPSTPLADLVAPAHTALVIVECQQGVIGELSNVPAVAEAGRAVVPAIARLAAAARVAGVKVVHATAAHPPDRWGANTNTRLFAAAARSPVQLVEGSDAAQPVPEIGVEPDDIVMVRRHGLSPLSGTELGPMLRNAGVTTVVLTGVSLNVAIPNAAFDAVNTGYQAVIPRDAVAGTPPEYADAVLDHTLAYVATLTTTSDLAGMWAAGR